MYSSIRKSSGLAVVALLTGLVAGRAAAQTQDLALVKTVPLPSELKVSISSEDEPHCDGTGNLLLPIWKGMGDLRHQLVRISPTGKVLTKVNLSSVPGFQQAEIYDFSDGPDGTTYVLALKGISAELTHDSNGEVIGAFHTFEPDDWLLVFGKDGRLISKAKLELSISVIAFEAFATGNVFVVGFSESDESFAGIFTGSGELVKRVVFPDDLTRQERKGQEGDVVSDHVRLRVASDGNAYLVTGGFFPKLSVFSPDGALIFSGSIELPEDAQELWLEQFSGEKMAAELITSTTDARHRTFAVFETRTGQMLNRYNTDIWDNFLVCFSEDTFAFMGNGGGAVHLLSPLPR